MSQAQILPLNAIAITKACIKCSAVHSQGSNKIPSKEAHKAHKATVSSAKELVIFNFCCERGLLGSNLNHFIELNALKAQAKAIECQRFSK